MTWKPSSSSRSSSHGEEKEAQYGLSHGDQNDECEGEFFEN
jgi:hypothetical protein